LYTLGYSTTPVLMLVQLMSHTRDSVCVPPGKRRLKPRAHDGRWHGASGHVLERPPKPQPPRGDGGAGGGVREARRPGPQSGGAAAAEDLPE
jgi:hypothetical protein